MTTLRREIIQTVFSLLELAYQDNPPSEEARRYNQEQAEKVADAVLELRAFKQKEELAKKSPEAAVLLGLAFGEISEQLDKESTALEAFERDMKFNPLPWGSTKAWEKLTQFVVQQYENDSNIFFKYKSWQEGDGMFEAMKNKQIYDSPDKFIATFPDFLKTLVKHEEEPQEPSDEIYI